LLLCRFAKEGVLRFLVGNKCDLENKRQVTFDQGRELAKQYNISFLETSAKETVNIDELFLRITKNFIEKQNSMNVKNEAKKEKTIKGTKLINVNNFNDQSKKKGCC
jgi:Ras-related protein Rab-1A